MARGGGLSEAPELSAGVASSTHSSVEVNPLAARTRTFSAGPSIATTALPASSWPVTIRRTPEATACYSAAARSAAKWGMTASPNSRTDRAASS